MPTSIQQRFQIECEVSIRISRNSRQINRFVSDKHWQCAIDARPAILRQHKQILNNIKLNPANYLLLLNCVLLSRRSRVPRIELRGNAIRFISINASGGMCWRSTQVLCGYKSLQPTQSRCLIGSSWTSNGNRIEIRCIVTSDCARSITSRFSALSPSTTQVVHNDSHLLKF